MSDEEVILTKDYKLVRQIGSGTFGKVFLGEHMPTSLPIAIKILDKTKITTPADHERILRELMLAKSVHHPHIIELLDIVEGEKYIFLIMELAKGGELYHHIVSQRRLSEPDAFAYFLQILNALEYLHEKGMTHRDLKPENVLLSADKRAVKLIDFGLGRSFEADELLKTPCGSPNYAPPEMLEGNAYDPRKADIWSLGVVLHAMAVGSLPFEDPQPHLLYQKIIECRYEPPEWLSPDMRELLRGMISPVAARLTIAEIRNTTWYRSAAANIGELGSCCGINHSILKEPNRDIVREIACNGVTADEVQRIVETRSFSAIYAHYFLLLSHKETLPESASFFRKESDMSLIFSSPQPQSKQSYSKAPISDCQRSLATTDHTSTPEPVFRTYAGPVNINHLLDISPLACFDKLSEGAASVKLIAAPKRGGFHCIGEDHSFFISVEALKGSRECCYITLEDARPSQSVASKFFRKELLAFLSV